MVKPFITEIANVETLFIGHVLFEPLSTSRKPFLSYATYLLNLPRWFRLAPCLLAFGAACLEGRPYDDRATTIFAHLLYWHFIRTLLSHSEILSIAQELNHPSNDYRPSELVDSSQYHQARPY